MRHGTPVVRAVRRSHPNRGARAASRENHEITPSPSPRSSSQRSRCAPGGSPMGAPAAGAPGSAGAATWSWPPPPSFAPQPAQQQHASPYANNSGASQAVARRPPQRRRERGRNGEKSRGLEILRDMQQAGVALDPIRAADPRATPGPGIAALRRSHHRPRHRHDRAHRSRAALPDRLAAQGRQDADPPGHRRRRSPSIIPTSASTRLLVDERPEEVTDFKRNTPAQVIAASSDLSIEEHISTTEYAMEVVAAQVLEGKDVVLLLDSITRLARAYNAGSEGSGRTMSGGLDSTAMQAPASDFRRRAQDRGRRLAHDRRHGPHRHRDPAWTR